MTDALLNALQVVTSFDPQNHLRSEVLISLVFRDQEVGAPEVLEISSW